MLFREQVERAYATGLISASQYEHALLQLPRGQRNQNEGLAHRHKR